MYEDHFRSAVVTRLREVGGYRGARLMRRRDGDEESFVAITFFDSFGSIRAFAGDDLEKAVIDPEARGLLARIEDRCAHYTIVVEDAPGA